MPLISQEGENLVTYYLLPLVGLNKAVFGRSFKSSFIDKEGSKVYINLTKEMSSTGYKKVKCYIADVYSKDKLYAVYILPEELSKDVQLFLKGFYSQMSRTTKKLIYAGSGLPYNKSVGDFKMSSPILQALDKSKVLRVFMLRVLGVDTLPNSGELITKPRPFWFIENQ